MSKVLFEKKPKGNKYVEIEKGEHRGLHKQPQYFPALKEFICYD